MIERRRRPFARDFLSDTATFYRCSWELYSQETLSETHRVWETILGSTPKAFGVGFGGLAETNFDLTLGPRNTHLRSATARQARTDAKPTNGCFI
jgi:hypothetical protein